MRQHPESSALARPHPWRLASDGARRASVQTILNRSCVRVPPDVLASTVAKYVVADKVTAVVVVDDGGRAIGIIGAPEIARALYNGDDSGGAARARQLMRPVSFELPEDATIAQAAALMAYEDLHEIPVISAEQTVIGVVTALDVARWFAQEEGYLFPGDEMPH